MATSRAVRLLGLWERHTKLCQSLKTPAVRPYAEMMLSRWVRPHDRGIPADLVKQTVGSLLRADFDELIETPGVGVTKLAKLIELLERVGKPTPSTEPETAQTEAGATTQASSAALGTAPDRQWIADVNAIRVAGLDFLPLGRLAPSLDELPRNLWMTPLSRFIALSYDELHSIPYFGPRRVAAVREIASEVARLAQTSGPADGNRTGLIPLIRQVEQRLAEIKTPTTDVIRREVMMPLFVQLSVDLGPRAVAVASRLLGLESLMVGEISGIDRQAAAAVSRPRMHQIREDIRLVFQARWPHGDRCLEDGIERAVRSNEASASGDFLGEICCLLYGRRPGRRSRWSAAQVVSTVTSVAAS